MEESGPLRFGNRDASYLTAPRSIPRGWPLLQKKTVARLREKVVTGFCEKKTWTLLHPYVDCVVDE